MVFVSLQLLILFKFLVFSLIFVLNWVALKIEKCEGIEVGFWLSVNFLVEGIRLR